MSRSLLAPTVAAVALAGTCLAAGSLGAAEAATAQPRQSTTAGGLLSPLSIAVADTGTRYFSQNFAGVLMKQVPGKAAKPVYSRNDGAEVGAVSVRGSSIRFAVSGESGAKLLGLRSSGVYGIADLGAYEASRNPDAKKTYGFVNLPAECAAQFPAEGQPPTYTGIVESHPYATTQSGTGTTYVADAAGNSILAVRAGAIRTVAVLPSKTLTVNAQFAEQAQMPACAIGRAYRFEPVPTDVEIGPDGKLYVSTLPGGPEDGSLGAGASVYRISPATGKITRVATGLVSATGLAVSPQGDVYVSELFAQKISRIPHGTNLVLPYAKLTLPGDVEWSRFGVFATSNVLSGLSGQEGDVPDGRVVRFF